MSNWRALLLPYRELKVALPSGKWFRRVHYHHLMTDQELSDGVESFRAFPRLVADLTDGRVQITADVRHPRAPLTTLSENGTRCYWPSPDDVSSVLNEFAPAGLYDSIFLLWPQHDSQKDSRIPCLGWGLGMGPGAWSNGCTYAVVANAPSSAWKGEAPGEVWLHEWLHGVCRFYQSRGYDMPERDADGAEIHGYTRSAERGWTEYYRALLNGTVPENGRLLGIPEPAWACGQPATARLSAS
jgi:hypothetical protein